VQSCRQIVARRSPTSSRLQSSWSVVHSIATCGGRVRSTDVGADALVAALLTHLPTRSDNDEVEVFPINLGVILDRRCRGDPACSQRPDQAARVLVKAREFLARDAGDAW
jgi:hypothetical protein